MRKPMPAPAFDDLIRRGFDMELILKSARPLDAKGRYLHWDQLRYTKPLPEGLDNHEQWWLATHLARSAHSHELPLHDAGGSPFRFCNVAPVQEAVHHISQRAGGHISLEEKRQSTYSGRQYWAGSLVRESIYSSLFEGAATTRQKARRLLQSLDTPRNRSEQMIINNFQAMRHVKKLAASPKPMTPDAVRELHGIITESTLDDKHDAGRVQQEGEERVFISDVMTGRPVFIPPPAEQLPERLERLCQWANGTADAGFIHPVVRAIVLHFMAAHDHYFVDGNGRLARALFYWSMLREGYWLAEYISISSIVYRHPKAYLKAYLYSETDNNDLTYFILHQLEVIQRAIKDLQRYLARKSAEFRAVQRLLRGKEPQFNSRQIRVISDAIRDPLSRFTVRGHASTFDVAIQTARGDLEQFVELDLLVKTTQGKRDFFSPAEDFEERLSQLPDIKSSSSGRAKRSNAAAPRTEGGVSVTGNPSGKKRANKGSGKKSGWPSSAGSPSRS
ncbi:MAG: Fic family protein [Gammaproteobacteria bacterium AqS3]|nr:Fic family protein [Gammaproteobacteria bacterium AqS3]